jgi:adenine phosphoribosyltransferase
MADVKLIDFDHPVPVSCSNSLIRSRGPVLKGLQGQPFADIFPIFRDPVATEALVSHLASHIKSTHDLSKISSLVCLESRGFFFAPLIAARLNLPCVPVRKGGKLPGDKIQVSYIKEYGADVFEVKTDAFEGIVTEGKKVILVDDLLGLGGSILAARQLVEQLGMKVAEAVFIFDIPIYYDINQQKLGDLPRYAMAQLAEESIVDKE